MPSDNPVPQIENWHNFQIESRREIVALLRTIAGKNQLSRMLINGEADVAVTTILEVDAEADELIIDCSINREQNDRIIAARRIGFETTLDKIRIMFSSDDVSACLYDERPALYLNIPKSMIRLQRRDLYRMETPVSNPVRCVIPVPDELGGPDVACALPLADISGGGIALLDEKMKLDNTIGRIYTNCRIDLPELGIVTCSLQIRSSHELTLLNGKANRRLGCQFREISKAMLDRVQRYITKLERERNSRINGLK
jgi:c-di-GMP-binding flagellar brake protein YcgR